MTAASPDPFSIAAFIVSAVAVVISAGSLALEIRRWIEAGPKLVVRVAPDMLIIDGDGGPGRPVVMVSVYNRGAAPTTITALAVMEFESFWARLRGRTVHNRAFLVPNPSFNPMAPGVPHELAPMQVWKGFISRGRDDILPNLLSGRFYAVVDATHRDRPYYCRIVPKPPPKAGA